MREMREKFASFLPRKSSLVKHANPSIVDSPELTETGKSLALLPFQRAGDW
jgi:hypothetical protein